LGSKSASAGIPVVVNPEVSPCHPAASGAGGSGIGGILDDDVSIVRKAIWYLVGAAPALNFAGLVGVMKPPTLCFRNSNVQEYVRLDHWTLMI
jgi:hypothetical protein